MPKPDPLWDPSADAGSPELPAIENSLSALRFDPASRPLAWPVRVTSSRRRGRRMAIGAALGLAASVLLVLGVGVWRWSWPEGRAWPMTPGGELVVGEWFIPVRTVQVDVARIGSMAVGPGARVTLRATASNAHRLGLLRGRVDVSVWAPPGAVVVETPAGDVVDMGCVFSLEVGPDGLSRVNVSSGWVMLDNAFGESLVPEGASSEMRAGRAPAVPVFDDAHDVFRQGVRRMEQAFSAGGGGAAPQDVAFLAAARPGDVMTLLRLALQAPSDTRRVLVRWAATVASPPASVDVEAAAAGDDDEIWRWHDALDLPSPKQWWRNWRDGFDWWR